VGGAGVGAAGSDEPAGQDVGRIGEAVSLECFAIAPSALGGAGGASAVDVGDPGVAQVDEVVDG
jgi:hypothetical protein